MRVVVTKVIVEGMVQDEDGCLFVPPIVGSLFS